MPDDQKLDVQGYPVNDRDAARGTPQLEGRAGEIWRDWAIFRIPQAEIAEKHGISQQRVGQILAGVRDSLEAPDRQAMIAQSIDTLSELTKRQFEIAALTPAPVVAGKDGEVVIDPESGQVVRDYSARLKALAEVRATDEQIAKRFGLSAPDRVESTATVKYEIVGVDPSDFT